MTGSGSRTRTNLRLRRHCVAGDEARPGGGWGEWRTVIPKEGECDGAVGAAVGIINALCTHPVLFHVIDGHPGWTT